MSKEDLKRIEKKIDDLNKKLDIHIDKIWKVYEALRNPINVVSKCLKKMKTYKNFLPEHNFQRNTRSFNV